MCIDIWVSRGSGKSALQWMAVNQSMVYIRWFRITSLAHIKDTASILRLIESLQPSTDAPVGLVLDDVGQFDVELFKTISIEARNKSGVIFLSSIRNEDVPVLGDISNASIVPVSLDESLAATIWEKLKSEDKTSWGYWKEPFLNCKGLLREYTHLLSQGERLGDLIKGQILRRRLRRGMMS